MPYRAVLYNFGIVRDFATMREAKAWVVKSCFEATVYLRGNLIATYGPIGGWK